MAWCDTAETAGPDQNLQPILLQPDEPVALSNRDLKAQRFRETIAVPAAELYCQLT
jgi:hypothetical protein